MMAVKDLVKSLIEKLRRISLTKNRDKESILKDLTTLPGIGENNCRVFYDAGFKSKKSIISASDQELMNIPGVGVSFIKRLRENLNSF
tara:strand:- start:104 stop:367 length:264 start_codon:yes stop_codon:yes gene_type:complete